MNPFRKLDTGTLQDADLAGPLLFCFLFGVSLLLSGKVHFGYIYGVATLGWISIFAILNLMTENGVNFYLTASVLGYCLLPMVLLSAVAVLLKLRLVYYYLKCTLIFLKYLFIKRNYWNYFGNNKCFLVYIFIIYFFCFRLRNAKSTNFNFISHFFTLFLFRSYDNILTIKTRSKSN